MTVAAAALLAAGLVGFGATGASAASTAVGPYTIEGTIDSGVGAAIPDPSGSQKELGPINASTTKIGVIHNATPPMLGLTNPNGQVDLNTAYLDLRRVGSADYLYFAWRRDVTTGSGFIAYEFMKAAAPTACAYDTATEADLIAGCNPWASRAAGDFMILWDQQGGSRDLWLRTWSEVGGKLVLSTGTTLTPGANSAAEYGDGGFQGEAAVNLTYYGLTTGTGCTTLANTVPSTVTGNSDTADYKDTILTTKQLSNCGTITINKVAQNGNGTFAYTTTGGLAGGAFNLTTTTGTTGNTASSTFSNVLSGSYTVTEAAQTAPWAFVSLVCSSTGTGTSVTPASSTTSRVASITLAGGGAVTCTYTNRLTYSPTITTKISPVGGVATTSTVVGSSVYDTATFTGASSDASGTVTYRVYKDSTCTTLAVAGTDIDAQPTAVTVTNGVIPNSANVQFLKAGSYQFQAVYSGDTKNSTATSTCGSEPLTVTQAPPTASTAQTFLPNDSFTLSGGYSPGGTITFKLFGPSNSTCSTASGAVAPVYTQTVTVNGNGTYSTTNNATTVTTPGTYRWLSAYSGDTNNSGVTSACGVEQFSFTNTSS